MTKTRKPVVSVILPAFNEEALLEDHVAQVVNYLQSLASRFDWEILIVNDGSKDNTGPIADLLATRYENVRAIHHPTNFGLGQTLRFGFANTIGDYVVTMDTDLSYDVSHIGELLDKLITTHAKIVLASPYMEGGEIRNVPWLRQTLSIWGNRFLSFFARGKLSTLTSMVRVYDGNFIRSLDLRSMGMDILPEMLYKAMVVQARVVETPGRLDWGPQNRYQHTRASSMRLLYHVFSTIVSGFLFRPFLFFILPGLLVGAFAIYVDFWILRHFLEAIAELRGTVTEPTYSQAFSKAFMAYPHTFVTGLMTTLLSIQLLGLGAIALQNTRYFEDLFHLGSTRLQTLKQPRSRELPPAHTARSAHTQTEQIPLRDSAAVTTPDNTREGCEPEAAPAPTKGTRSAESDEADLIS